MSDRQSISERAGRGQQQARDLTAQRAQLDETVRDNLPFLDAILPSFMNAAQFAAIVNGMLIHDDDLAMAAIMNPPSFLAAMADCARLGLMPGDGYAFIPLGVGENSRPSAKAEVLGLTEYTGEIQLIYRTGLVEAVIAEVVRANDYYQPGEHEHDPPTFKRQPSEFASDDERGPIVGVFAYCVLKGGGFSQIIRMNMQTLMAHREVAKTKKIWDGPFKGSMYLKTAVHELYKWVQRSVEYLTGQVASASALAGTPLGVLPRPQAAELDAPDQAGRPAPSLVLRAIGSPAQQAPQQQRRERRRGRGYQRIVELFEQIGCAQPDEQLRVVQAIVPDYAPGAQITEQQAGPIIAQLERFIADADDIGEPGSDDEFAGRTPYDVLRDWLASPAGPPEDQGVRNPARSE